jgi:energy-coupling factor transporter ATP-binding protein EcfA2
MTSPAVEGNGQAQAAIPDRSELVLPEPTRDLEEIADENTLVDRWAAQLTGENLSFTRDFLAHLYICLKASALNLITGPPGYGKSSVIGSLARALGHGNALLEIAVRRSWSDDRYLLGFYDAFHGRYDPGPTGLATRLLQAQCDWESDKTGLYFVLLDEFNLAAPEYYFSQLLQILTRPSDQRILRLFDLHSVAAKASDPLHEIRIHPNVSVWGTINYDETTERLSPRLLDRTGMVFLSSRDVLGAVPAGEPGNRLPRRGVKAAQIFGKFCKQADHCPSDLWDAFEPLLELLRRQTDEWGAGIDLSPRVIDAVKRYLANSTGLLAPVRAADYAFEQRVLPVLRGRGAGYTARIRALGDRLAERGLERSARHVRDALAYSELHFGDIDFLAY